MLVICITHAEAEPFMPRPLTAAGRLAAAQAAQHIIDKVEGPHQGYRLVCSPSLRCLETLLIVASSLGASANLVSRAPRDQWMSQVRVDPRLAEQPGAALTRRELLGTIRDQADDGSIHRPLLICTHGDLASALAPSQLGETSNGFFSPRPVVVSMEVDLEAGSAIRVVGTWGWCDSKFEDLLAS